MAERQPFARPAVSPLSKARVPERDDREVSGRSFNTMVTTLAKAPPLSLRTTFSRLCLEGRHRVGMTQETLSSIAHVSRSHIAKIELGQADPSLDVAERLARGLGLEVELIAR